MGRARQDDITLFAASLGFYALVSVVPLTIFSLWIVGLVLGQDRVQHMARELGRVAPKNIGADKFVERIADMGTRLGVVAAITGLWPATAYGSGLRRAFDRLAGGKEGEAGLRGRGLLLLVLLPVFVVGSLAASFAGTQALGSTTGSKVIGFALALVTGFAATAVALLPFVKFPTSQDQLGNHAIGLRDLL